MLTVDDETKSQYYGASLGFYKAYLKDTFGNATNMVAAFNEFTTSREGLAYAGGSGEVPGSEFARGGDNLIVQLIVSAFFSHQSPLRRSARWV